MADPFRVSAGALAALPIDEREVAFAALMEQTIGDEFPMLVTDEESILRLTVRVRQLWSIGVEIGVWPALAGQHQGDRALPGQEAGS
jgi:hypothetical protein